MRETRKYEINKKRFSREDLLAIAKIFKDQFDPQEKEWKEIKFTLKCRDGTEYSTTELDIFEKNGEINIKPPESIYFYYSTFHLRKKIQLSLVHNSKYEDYLIVEGDDREWVNSIFTKLKERISAFETSESWFTRHPKLTLHSIILSLGSIYYFGICLILLVFLKDYLGSIPEPTGLGWKTFKIITDNKIFPWLLRWLFGFSWGGISAYFWLIEAWPSIELDVGPEDYKIYKRRREKIRFVLAGIILPIIIAITVDLIK